MGKQAAKGGRKGGKARTAATRDGDAARAPGREASGAHTQSVEHERRVEEERARRARAEPDERREERAQHGDDDADGAAAARVERALGSGGNGGGAGGDGSDTSAGTPKRAKHLMDADLERIEEMRGEAERELRAARDANADATQQYLRGIPHAMRKRQGLPEPGQPSLTSRAAIQRFHEEDQRRSSVTQRKVLSATKKTVARAAARLADWEKELETAAHRRRDAKEGTPPATVGGAGEEAMVTGEVPPPPTKGHEKDGKTNGHGEGGMAEGCWGKTDEEIVLLVRAKMAAAQRRAEREEDVGARV